MSNHSSCPASPLVIQLILTSLRQKTLSLNGYPPTPMSPATREHKSMPSCSHPGAQCCRPTRPTIPVSCPAEMAPSPIRTSLPVIMSLHCSLRRQPATAYRRLQTHSLLTPGPASLTHPQIYPHACPHCTIPSASLTLPKGVPSDPLKAQALTPHNHPLRLTLIVGSRPDCPSASLELPAPLRCAARVKTSAGPPSAVGGFITKGFLSLFSA